MDIKDLKGLMEAYSEIYVSQEVDEATAMAKRGYDEAPIRQKIAKSTGGGAAADRATKLADKQTFRGDGSARDKLARTQRGDFRKTTSSSPGLRGYAHKSDDPKVKAKQAARGAQRGVLTPDEKKRLNREEFDVFEIVLEFLCVEGYAETLEEAEWMMANLIDEEAIDIIVEAMHEDEDEEDENEMKKGKKSKKEEDEDEDEEKLDEALTGERYKKVMKKTGGTAYSRKVSLDPSKRATRGGRGGESDFGAGDRGSGNKAARRAGTYQEAFEAWLNEAMSSYEKNRKRAAARAEARNAARDQGKTGAVPGVGYVSPRREKISLRDKFGDAAGTRMAKAKPPRGDEKY